MFQPGKDSISYEGHLKHLQGEFSKTKRNPQIVTELMVKTYPLRRVEVLEPSPSLSELFERFPFLQEVDHVSAPCACIYMYVWELVRCHLNLNITGCSWVYSVNRAIYGIYTHAVYIVPPKTLGGVDKCHSSPKTLSGY